MGLGPATPPPESGRMGRMGGSVPELGRMGRGGAGGEAEGASDITVGLDGPAQV